MRRQERRRGRRLKEPIATGPPVFCARDLPHCVADRPSLHFRANPNSAHALRPRASDGGGIGETSVGNYSNRGATPPGFDERRAAVGIGRGQCSAFASHSRLGTFRTYCVGWFRDRMRDRNPKIRAMLSATQERGSMHQEAAFSATRRALMRLPSDFAETILRFVSAQEN